MKTLFGWTCAMMVMAALSAGQAQAQTILWEDFNGDGTNEDLTDMSTASWHTVAPYHNIVRESGQGNAPYDPGDGTEACCYASHPGQGGGSRRGTTLDSPIDLNDPVGSGGPEGGKIDMSYVAANDGNSWSFAGAPASTLTIGSGLTAWNTAGDRINIGMRAAGTDDRTHAVIFASDDQENAPEITIETQHYTDDGKVVVQVRALIGADSTEVFWRPVHGIVGETDIPAGTAISGAWRSYGILDGIGTNPIDTIRISNGGSTHAAHQDSISVVWTPEPASAVLLGLGGLMMLRRRLR